MVAIFAGVGLGLERGSGWILGSKAQTGQASLGRANDGVYVNAANGNLVISNQDDFLVGLGPDSPMSRTYNSEGLLNDDFSYNHDNWRGGFNRMVGAPTGTANSSGSTITRTDWDGSTAVYTWDGTASAYVFHDEKGADDTITYNTTTHVSTERRNWLSTMMATTVGG